VVAKLSGGLHFWLCLPALLDWLIFWIRLTPWYNSKGSVLWCNTGWPRNWSHSFSHFTWKTSVQTIINHVTWEKHNLKVRKWYIWLDSLLFVTQVKAIHVSTLQFIFYNSVLLTFPPSVFRVWYLAHCFFIILQFATWKKKVVTYCNSVYKKSRGAVNHLQCTVIQQPYKNNLITEQHRDDKIRTGITMSFS
jgi:hypothetical protein